MPAEQKERPFVEGIGSAFDITGSFGRATRVRSSDHCDLDLIREAGRVVSREAWSQFYALTGRRSGRRKR